MEKISMEAIMRVAMGFENFNIFMIHTACIAIQNIDSRTDLAITDGNSASVLHVILSLILI